MNQSTLEDQLRDTLRRSETGAPRAVDVRRAAREALSPRPRQPRATAWWPTVLAAAAVVAIVAGVALWRLPAHGSTPVSQHETASPSIEPQRSVTLFLVNLEAGAPAGTPWSLTPLEVSTVDTSDQAGDALRALLEEPPPAGSTLDNLLRPSPGYLTVNEVQVTPRGILVDLTSPTGQDLSVLPSTGGSCEGYGCTAGQAMLQQLVWTVSTALQVETPIEFSVDGNRVDRLFGYTFGGRYLPVAAYLAASARDFPWFQDACGAWYVTAYRDVGRAGLPEEGPYDETSAPLVLTVGDRVSVAVHGSCFDQQELASTRPAGLSVAKGPWETALVVASRPGRYRVTFPGNACWVTLGNACANPDEQGPDHYITVQVEPKPH